MMLLVVEATVWSRAERFDDGGAFVDALAVAGALALACALGGWVPKSFEPKLVDRALGRLLSATLAGILACAIASMFAFYRLDALELAPIAQAGSGTVLVSLVPLAFLGGSVLAGGAFFAFTRLPERWLVFAACFVLGGAVALEMREQSSADVDFEAARAIDTLSAPAIVLEPTIETVEIDGTRWEYVALGNECFFRVPGADPTVRALGSVSSLPVVPTRTEDGAAVCPSLELRADGERTLIVIPSVEPSPHVRDQLVGSIVDRKLRVARGGIPGFEELRDTVLRAPKTGEVAGPRARPGADTFDVLDRAAETAFTLSPVRIRRSAANLQSCEVSVEHGDERIFTADFASQRRDDRVTLCPTVDVYFTRQLGPLLLASPGLAHNPDGVAKGFVTLLPGARSPKLVSLRDVTHRLRAPLAFTLLSRVGIVGSSALLALAALEACRRRRWRGFVTAQHDSGGVIVFDDGRRVLVEAARALPHGALVMARGDVPADKAQDYRNRPELTRSAIELVEAGVFDQEKQRHDARLRLAAAAALGLVIVTSSLSLVALACGL